MLFSSFASQIYELHVAYN